MESPVAGYIITTVPKILDGAHTIHPIEAGARNEQNPGLIRPLMWPRQTPTDENVEDHKPQASGLYDERDLDQIRDPASSYLLVTEEATGNAVAYVFWQHQRGKSEEEWAAFYKERYRQPGLNHGLADATGGVRILKRAKILGDQDCLTLKELFVRHKHQRQGLGGMLVAWGCRKADETGLKAYCEATADGLQLYLRHGFKEIDRVTLDLEPWGGKKGDLDSYGVLLREPRS